MERPVFARHLDCNGNTIGKWLQTFQVLLIKTIQIKGFKIQNSDSATVKIQADGNLTFGSRIYLEVALPLFDILGKKERATGLFSPRLIV